MDQTKSQPAAHFDVAIMQPGYLPWLGYFDLVAMADCFVIYDDVQFDKGGWRNRNRILGPRGEPQWLTVPIVTAGKLAQSLRDTAINSDACLPRHLSTIRQNYRKAPYFDWCFPALDGYLGQKKYGWLVDLCVAGHQAFCNLIGVQTPVRFSSELGLSGVGRTERLVALCRVLNATRYIAADASKSYMDEPRWPEAGVELVYQNYPHPVYAQFSETFVSHLSIVDALMFAGPNVRSFVGISHSKHKGRAPLHPQKVRVGRGGQPD